MIIFIKEKSSVFYTNSSFYLLHCLKLRLRYWKNINKTKSLNQIETVLVAILQELNKRSAGI